mmetsp:Transcript_17830/g.57760  ORF Transcript_17830/g.57760 Transcript_17830/m.57760 type:complete len:287 (+) Transcript_17830:590-1450(+)
MTGAGTPAPAAPATATSIGTGSPDSGGSTREDTGTVACHTVGAISTNASAGTTVPARLMRGVPIGRVACRVMTILESAVAAPPPADVATVSSESSGTSLSNITGEGSAAVPGGAVKVTALPVMSSNRTSKGIAAPEVSAATSAGVRSPRLIDPAATGWPAFSGRSAGAPSRAVGVETPARTSRGANTASLEVIVVVTLSKTDANLSAALLEIIKKSSSAGGVVSTTTGSAMGGKLAEGSGATFVVTSRSGPNTTSRLPSGGSPAAAAANSASCWTACAAAAAAAAT